MLFDSRDLIFIPDKYFTRNVIELFSYFTQPNFNEKLFSSLPSPQEKIERSKILKKFPFFSCSAFLFKLTQSDLVKNLKRHFEVISKCFDKISRWTSEIFFLITKRFRNFEKSLEVGMENQQLRTQDKFIQSSCEELGQSRERVGLNIESSRKRVFNLYYPFIEHGFDMKKINSEKCLRFTIDYPFRYIITLDVYLEFTVCTVKNSEKSKSSILPSVNKKSFEKYPYIVLNQLKKRLIVNKSDLKCSLIDGLKGGGCPCIRRTIIEPNGIIIRPIQRQNKYETKPEILEFEKNAHDLQDNYLKNIIKFSASSKLENLKLYDSSKNQEIKEKSSTLSNSLLTGSVKRNSLTYLIDLKPAKIKDPFEVGIQIIKSLYEEKLWYNQKFFDIRRAAVTIARKFIAIGILKNPDFTDDKIDLKNYINMLEKIVQENELVTPDNIVSISLKAIKEMVEYPYMVFFLWYWIDKSQGLLDLMDSLFCFHKFDSPVLRECKLLEDLDIFHEYGRKICTYFLLFDSIEAFSRSYTKNKYIEILKHIYLNELLREKDSDIYNVIVLEFLLLIIQQESLDISIRCEILENILKINLKNPEIAEKCLLICRKTCLNSDENIRHLSYQIRQKISDYFKIRNKRIESVMDFQLIKVKFNKLSSDRKINNKIDTYRVTDLKFFRQNKSSKILKKLEMENQNFVILEGLFRMGKKRLAIYYANMHHYYYHSIFNKNIKSEEKMKIFFDKINKNLHGGKKALIIAVAFIDVQKIIESLNKFKNLKVIIISGKKDPKLSNRITISGLNEESSEKLFELHLGLKLKETCKNISNEKFVKIIKCLQGWPFAIELVSADMHENSNILNQRLDVYIECFSNQEIEKGLLDFVFKNKLSSIDLKLLDIISFCKPPKIPAWVCRKILKDKKFVKEVNLLESHYIIERFDSYISIHPYIHNNIPKRERNAIREEFVNIILEKFEVLKGNFEKIKDFIRHVKFFLEREKIDDGKFLDIQMKIIYFYFVQENFNEFQKKISSNSKLFLEKVKQISTSKKKKIDYITNLIRIYYDHQNFEEVKELLEFSFQLDDEVSIFRYYFSAKVTLLRNIHEKKISKEKFDRRKNEQIFQVVKNHLEKFVALKDMVDDLPLYPLAESLFILAFEYQKKKYLKDSLMYLKKSSNDENSENKIFEAFTDCMVFKTFCIFCGSICTEQEKTCVDCENAAQYQVYIKYCIALLYLEDNRTFDEKYEINDINYDNLCRDLLEDHKESLIKACNEIRDFLINQEESQNSCKFSKNNKIFYILKFSTHHFEKALGIISCYTREKEDDNGIEIHPKAFSHFISYFRKVLKDYSKNEDFNKSEQLLIRSLINPCEINEKGDMSKFSGFNDRVFLKDYFLLFLWADLLLSFKNRFQEALSKFGTFLFMYFQDLRKKSTFSGIDPVLCMKTLKKISDALENSDLNELFSFDKMLFNFLKIYQSRYKEKKNFNEDFEIKNLFKLEKNLQKELIETNQKILKRFERLQLEDTQEIIDFYVSIIQEDPFIHILSKDDLFKYNYKVSLYYYSKKSEVSFVFMKNSLKTYQKTNDLEILANLSKFSSKLSKIYKNKSKSLKSVQFLNHSIILDNSILSLNPSQNLKFKLKLTEKHKKLSDFHLSSQNFQEAHKELDKILPILSNDSHPKIQEELKKTLLNLLLFPQENHSKKKYLNQITLLEKNEKNLAEYFEQIAICEETEAEIISSYNKSANLFKEAGLKENHSRILLTCAEHLEKTKPKEAIFYFKSFLAVEVDLKQRSPEELVKYFSRLKKLCEETEQYKEVRNSLENLIKMYEAYDCVEFRPQILKVYGKLSKLMINSPDEKNEFNLKRIEIAELLNDAKSVSKAYEDLVKITSDPEIIFNAAEYCFNLGPSRYKKALRLYKSSAMLFKSEGNSKKACKSFEMVIKLTVELKGKQKEPFALEIFKFLSNFNEESFLEKIYFESFNDDADFLQKSFLSSTFAEILMFSNKNPKFIEKHFLDSLDLASQVLTDDEMMKRSNKISEKLLPFNETLSLNFQLKAISYLAKKPENNGKRADLIRELAKKYKDLKRFEESIKLFKESIKIGRGDESDHGALRKIENHLDMAEVYEKNKLFQKAQSQRVKALKFCINKIFVGNSYIQKNIEVMEKNEKILGNNAVSSEFLDLKIRYLNDKRMKNVTPTSSTKTASEHSFK